MSDQVSIVTCARDQFSCIDAHLTLLTRETAPEVPIVAVIGGAPQHLRQEWERRHGGRVRFRFEERFLSHPAAHNLGLRLVETPLAVTMETDTFPRPGWLEPLLACQRETGAMMVVPLILERPRRIHCAGNDLYITYEEDGRGFGHKTLRMMGFPYAARSNLTRRRTDYGELHCQLIQVEPTLRLAAYDERIMEVGEVDSSLTWAAAGGELWCEPRSVVHFVEDAPLRAQDVPFFLWRWDLAEIRRGYDVFQAKWGFDITEHGEFRRFLMRRHERLGFLARRLPYDSVLELGRVVRSGAWKVRHALALPDKLWFALRARDLGYDAWPTYPEQRLNEDEQGHPLLR
mgnify:CR=1 FL=1